MSRSRFAAARLIRTRGSDRDPGRRSRSGPGSTSPDRSRSARPPSPLRGSPRPLRDDPARAGLIETKSVFKNGHRSAEKAIQRPFRSFGISDTPRICAISAAFLAALRAYALDASARSATTQGARRDFRVTETKGHHMKRTRKPTYDDHSRELPFIRPQQPC